MAAGLIPLSLLALLVVVAAQESPCSPACQNNATCTPTPNSEGSYFCDCPTGFTGVDCSSRAAAAAPSTQASSACTPACQNNGVCQEVVNSPGSYACSCPEGFSGVDCSTTTMPSAQQAASPSASPCTPACQNQGVCTDTPNSPGSYFCSCPAGFAGTDCSTQQGVSPAHAPAATQACSPACQNGGTCAEVFNSPGSYACECPAGYTGIACATGQAASPSQAEACTPACQNGGSCAEVFNSPGSYACQCASGYSGLDCTVMASPAAAAGVTSAGCSPACQNNGTCAEVYNSPGVYACLCPTGFTGLTCQTATKSIATPPTAVSSKQPEKQEQTENGGLPAWAAALIAVAAGLAITAFAFGVGMYVLKQRRASSFTRFKDGGGMGMTL